jgi:antibiotic biosynthesis monooxygenase (ABM) superfamily enzyme
MLGGMGGTVRAKLTFLLVAWLAAFIVVMLLFLVFGWLLEELPLAGRALVISGVLTITMTQLALPLINRILRNPNRGGHTA